MEFVGLIGNIPNHILGLINETALNYGYKVIHNNTGYDSEIKVGMDNFMAKMQCETVLQFVLEEDDEKTSTYSDLITFELQNLNINKVKSRFLDFLSDIKGANDRIGKCYLVFASEWESTNDLIRFYANSSLTNIDIYFKLNVGWYFTLFNCNNQSYQYEFEYPLVFEIV
ncbi:MAG TPA: hypothetical protein VK498_06060 [Ferruginibacter sp.]|nr:hypothetical protein [Ferruginibacter sp.]